MSTPEGGLPRGIRNKNPGNLKTSPDYAWKGQVGADPQGFCRFSHPLYGLRALGITAYNYVHLNGVKTLNEFFQRYSPTPTGRWADYARYVGDAAGVEPDAPIELDIHAWEYMHAVVMFENGTCPYPTCLLYRAITASHVH